MYVLRSSILHCILDAACLCILIYTVTDVNYRKGNVDVNVMYINIKTKYLQDKHYLHEFFLIDYINGI